MFGTPLGVVSASKALFSPTELIAAPKRSGRVVIALLIKIPPALPPMIPKCCGEVYFSAIKYSAQAIKSFQVFGLVAPLPAKCHSSPYSPPPRTPVHTTMPPRSSHGSEPEAKYGEVLSDPYAP